MNDLIVVPRPNHWQKLKALRLDIVFSPIAKRVYNLGLDEFIALYGQMRPHASKVLGELGIGVHALRHKTSRWYL